jgi:hypothetical protein
VGVEGLSVCGHRLPVVGQVSFYTLQILIGIECTFLQVGKQALNGQHAPNMYSFTYCDRRHYGVTKESVRARAKRATYIAGASLFFPMAMKARDIS